MHSWKKNKTYFFMLAFNKSLLLFSLLLPFCSLPSMLLSLFARSLVSVTTSRTSASQIKFSSLETSRVGCNPFCRPLHFHRRNEARLGAVPWCSPTSDSSVTRNHTALSWQGRAGTHLPLHTLTLFSKVRYHDSSPGTLPCIFPIALQRRLQLPPELLCVSLPKLKRQTLQL